MENRKTCQETALSLGTFGVGTKEKVLYFLVRYVPAFGAGRTLNDVASRFTGVAQCVPNSHDL